MPGDKGESSEDSESDGEEMKEEAADPVDDLVHVRLFFSSVVLFALYMH